MRSFKINFSEDENLNTITKYYTFPEIKKYFKQIIENSRLEEYIKSFVQEDKTYYLYLKFQNFFEEEIIWIYKHNPYRIEKIIEKIIILLFDLLNFNRNVLTKFYQKETHKYYIDLEYIDSIKICIEEENSLVMTRNSDGIRDIQI